MLTAHAADLTASEAAWLREFAQGQRLSMELLSRCSALLCEARLAPLAACLGVLLRVLEVLSVWAAASSAAFAQREAWMRAFLGLNGPPPSAAASASASAAGAGAGEGPAGGETHVHRDIFFRYAQHEVGPAAQASAC